MRSMKKLAATLWVAILVVTMGAVAFAAGPPKDGSYTARQNLYKNAECTTLSMGDKAVNDMRADISVSKGKATLVVRTHEIKYLGLNGHLGKMEVNGVAKKPQTRVVNGVKEYSFTFTGLDASMFYEGCTITGRFTTYVGIMPMRATGYLKLTEIQ